MISFLLVNRVKIKFHWKLLNLLSPEIRFYTDYPFNVHWYVHNLTLIRIFPCKKSVTSERLENKKNMLKHDEVCNYVEIKIILR